MSTQEKKEPTSQKAGEPILSMALNIRGYFVRSVVVNKVANSVNTEANLRTKLSTADKGKR